MTDAMATEGLPTTHEMDPPVRLEEEAVKLLKVWKSRQSELSDIDVPGHCHLRKKIAYRGMSLMPEKSSLNDSLVILGNSNSWRPAQIESVFDITVYPDGEKRVYTLCKIKYFMELADCDLSEDTYRRHSNAGRVFYSQAISKKGIVSVDQILCHSSMTPDVFPKISRPHMHILPLFG
jgi:hypothetical protein